VGAPINEKNVERGLMLLNDLPNIGVKSTLVPGATPGTSDLVVETVEGGVASGGVDIDNYGNKYTGSIRGGVTVNLNDLSGYGDQIVVRGMTSGSGMGYGRLAYSLPVGDAGTKAGAAYSRMNYRLGGDFEPLRATGESSVASLFAVHPVIRSRNSNVFVTASYDNKRILDDQNSVNVTKKTADVVVVGFAGDSRDGVGGGGLTAGSLSFTSGRLNVSGNANYAATDAITALTDGAYSKVNYSLSRLQRLDDAWSLYAGLSGQAANKNLDSSEKFSLGGMGVRAYPQGEASGDTGALLNLEARYTVPGIDIGTLQVVGFIDTGSIILHQNPWAGWQPTGRPNYPNAYTLSGIGFGLNLYKEGDFSIRTSAAWKIGTNPGADAAGNDSDSENRGVRIWLQATKQF
jgi:hemolysin activation/secretion protein